MKKLMGLMVALGAVVAFAIEDDETFKLIGWRTVESRTAAKGADIVFTVDGSAGRFFRVIVTDP